MNIIIFRRNNVRPVTLSVRPVLLAGCGIVLLAGMLGNVFWLQSLYTGFSPLDGDPTLQWRVQLAEQKSRLEALRGQAVSDSQAVGRRLASLQAKFLRLEALGDRLTDVAGLKDGEFSFGEPAAVGGPEAPQRSVLDDDAIGFDFAQQLAELSARLDAREVELNVLDGLLVNQQLQDQRSPRRRPITWGWLSSKYGNRVDPITGKPAWHAGIDFAGKTGAPVVAVAGGVVTYAGRRSGYGKLVEINHGDGYVTRYGHHQDITVEVGDIVKKGEQIGLMGSTGRSTGPHVHFELMQNGKTQDPTAFLGRS